MLGKLGVRTVDVYRLRLNGYIGYIYVLECVFVFVGMGAYKLVSGAFVGVVGSGYVERGVGILVMLIYM